MCPSTVPAMPAVSEVEGSLAAILDAILAAGDAQVQEIAAQASVQAHEILADNLLEAKLIKEQAYQEASSPAVRERSRVIHLAHLEAMQILGKARDTLVEKAFDAIRDCLLHYRADPNYPVVLSRLVQETLTELEGSTVEAQGLDRSSSTTGLPTSSEVLLLADQRDDHVLEDVLTTRRLELPHPYEQELPIQYELECWGGIHARSLDGRIVSINTLEARLERATPALQRFLAAYFEPVAQAVIATTGSDEGSERFSARPEERLPATRR